MTRTTACAATLVALLAIPAALAATRAERTAHASIAGGAIRLGGKPFFPVMLIDQCDAGAAARARRLGVNLILNEHCAGVSARKQLAQIAPGAFAVVPMGGGSVQGKRLVGFTFPDEPENNGWTPSSLRKRFAFRPGSSDGLISFLTTSGRFFGGVYRNPSVPESVFGQFARLSDVAGFDLYPLNHCQQDLSAVADAQAQFVQLAGSRPTFQWIETGPIEPRYCGGFQMTPDQLSAETWLAVVGGARGIGFFTHTWSPAHKAFDVTPDIRSAIARTSTAIEAVQPGLTGKTIESSTDSSAIRILARTGGDGRTYVFAVNASSQPIKSQLDVPLLGTKTIGGLGQSTYTRTYDGQFVTTFPPYGVRIFIASS